MIDSWDDLIEELGSGKPLRVKASLLADIKDDARVLKIPLWYVEFKGNERVYAQSRDTVQERALDWIADEIAHALRGHRREISIAGGRTSVENALIRAKLL